MVFRNNVSRHPIRAAKAAPEPAPERERTAEIPPRKAQHSFIHADTKVTGDLEGVGDISVEGSVEGNISCRTLTLRGEPTITGDVHAEAVHVCGRFTGALHAKKVVLTKAARMTGDINYKILELHEGAEFEGSMRRTGASSSRPVTSAGMAPDEPQQPVHASIGTEWR
jgi:cytoskeletal protein CcmA (bactofilin family)